MLLFFFLLSLKKATENYRQLQSLCISAMHKHFIPLHKSFKVTPLLTFFI